MSTRNLPRGKGRWARKADKLTAICELIVQKMWEPRRLTTLWVSTACYEDSFTFTLSYITNVFICKDGSVIISVCKGYGLLFFRYVCSQLRDGSTYEYESKKTAVEGTYSRVDNAVSIFAGKRPQIISKQQHRLMHTVILLSFYYRGINLAAP
jgi:hypothetical protein